MTKHTGFPGGKCVAVIVEGEGKGKLQYRGEDLADAKQKGGDRGKPITFGSPDGDLTVDFKEDSPFPKSRYEAKQGGWVSDTIKQEAVLHKHYKYTAKVGHGPADDPEIIVEN